MIEPNKGRDRLSNELWSLDIDTIEWTQLHPTGTAPAPRALHAAAVLDNGTMLVYGGIVGNVVAKDSFLFDPKAMTWTAISPIGHGPGPLYGHSMSCNVWFPNVVLLFGGKSSTAPPEEETEATKVWRLDMNDWSGDGKRHGAWHLEKAVGRNPPMLFGHCAMTAVDQLVIYGGIGRSGYSNGNIYALQMANPPERNADDDEANAAMEEFTMPGLIQAMQALRSDYKKPESKEQRRRRSVMKAAKMLEQKGLHRRSSMHKDFVEEFRSGRAPSPDTYSVFKESFFKKRLMNQRAFDELQAKDIREMSVIHEEESRGGQQLGGGGAFSTIQQQQQQQSGSGFFVIGGGSVHGSIGSNNSGGGGRGGGGGGGGELAGGRWPDVPLASGGGGGGGNDGLIRAEGSVVSTGSSLVGVGRRPNTTQSVSAAARSSSSSFSPMQRQRQGMEGTRVLGKDPDTMRPAFSQSQRPQTTPASSRRGGGGGGAQSGGDGGGGGGSATDPWASMANWEGGIPPDNPWQPQQRERSLISREKLDDLPSLHRGRWESRSAPAPGQHRLLSKSQSLPAPGFGVGTGGSRYRPGNASRSSRRQQMSSSRSSSRWSSRLSKTAGGGRRGGQGGRGGLRTAPSGDGQAADRVEQTWQAGLQKMGPRYTPAQSTRAQPWSPGGTTAVRPRPYTPPNASFPIGRYGGERERERERERGRAWCDVR